MPSADGLSDELEVPLLEDVELLFVIIPDCIDDDDELPDDELSALGLELDSNDEDPSVDVIFSCPDLDDELEVLAFMKNHTRKK